MKRNISSELNEDIKSLIVNSLKDDKAEEIVDIDLRGKSDIADYMIIATGRSDRHVGAVAKNLINKLRSQRLKFSMEGEESKEWILIDAFNIIVHLFQRETREKYQLESFWQE